MSELKGFHACWWKLSWIIVAKLEPAAPVRLWYDNWSSSHQTKQGTEETETLLSIQCQTIKFGNFSLCTLHGGKLTNLIVQTSSFRTKLFSSPLWRCRYRRSFSRLNLCKKKKKKTCHLHFFTACAILNTILITIKGMIIFFHMIWQLNYLHYLI